MGKKQYKQFVGKTVGSTEDKYKKTAKMIHKVIKNKYIDQIFNTWETVINGVTHKMNSNISAEECIFIHKLIMVTKPKKVFEYGMANGMSTMIILNALNKVGGNVLYSNDPFQIDHWKGIGLFNASKVKNKVEHNHIKRLSTDNFNDFESEFFDMILIDGAHDKDNVILDINNSKRMLKLNGIMILDDVLHDGVHEAIKEVLKNDRHYVRVCPVPTANNKCTDNLDEKYNPKTMHAYQKIN